MKALDDLLWLKEQLEKERDFDEHAPGGMDSQLVERILARIQPAIDTLGAMTTSSDPQHRAKEIAAQIIRVVREKGHLPEHDLKSYITAVVQPLMEDLEDYKRYLKMSHATNKRRGKVIVDLKERLDAANEELSNAFAHVEQLKAECDGLRGGV